MILERMDKEGFAFLKYKPQRDVMAEILNFHNEKIPCHSEQDLGMGGTTWEPPIEQYIPETVKFFKDLLSDLGVCRDYLHFDLEMIKKDDYHFLHTHLTPAHYQLCAWFPLGDFEGREFIYGEKHDLKRFKPSNGDMVFFKPNDPRFVHGTSPLTTEIPVYSIGITCSPSPTRYIARDIILRPDIIS